MRRLLRIPPWWIAGALLGALMMVAGPVHATTTTIGIETNSGGFTGDLFKGKFGAPAIYLVASDGEAAFQPFGVTFDVSDGLNFSAVPHVWNQATGSIWTSIGFQTWVLPAVIPGCGSENEPKCEPTGHFVSPDPWVPGAIGTWLILDSTIGPLSDKIVTFNKGGQANLLFFSDPSLPEPATLAVLGVGLLGLAAVRRRRG